jgi:hypothetical protein
MENTMFLIIRHDTYGYKEDFIVCYATSYKEAKRAIKEIREEVGPELLERWTYFSKEVEHYS